jgi:hypothetical protein
VKPLFLDEAKLSLTKVRKRVRLLLIVLKRIKESKGAKTYN